MVATWLFATITPRSVAPLMISAVHYACAQQACEQRGKVVSEASQSNLELQCTMSSVI